MDLDKASILMTSFFREYDPSLNSYLLENGQVLSADIQKVGAIKAKETVVEIFNLHLQAKLGLKVEHHEYSIYVVSLGNLNTSGISD